jgi:GT2 family glycosyltransferase
VRDAGIANWAVTGGNGARGDPLAPQRLGLEAEFAGSFNFAATRRALESVGGFDATFPAPSGEDNDLSYRLRDAGVRIAFVADAVVDHHHPTSLRRYLAEQMRHGEWRVVLYARHPRRVRGDGYAGPAELAAPPLALLALALAAAAPFRPQAAGAASGSDAGHRAALLLAAGWRGTPDR